MSHHRLSGLFFQTAHAILTARTCDSDNRSAQAQRGEVACPVSHSSQMVELGLEPKVPNFHPVFVLLPTVDR